MLRKRLRIAWTVFFAVLTVVLCLLCVRSYWWADLLKTRTSTVAASALGNAHFAGTVGFYPSEQKPTYPLIGTSLYLACVRIVPNPSADAYRNTYSIGSVRTTIVIPYFLPIAVTVSLAAAPWVTWSKQFTLRT